MIQIQSKYSFPSKPSEMTLEYYERVLCFSLAEKQNDIAMISILFDCPAKVIAEAENVDELIQTVALINSWLPAWMQEAEKWKGAKTKMLGSFAFPQSWATCNLAQRALWQELNTKPQHNQVSYALAIFVGKQYGAELADKVEELRLQINKLPAENCLNAFFFFTKRQSNLKLAGTILSSGLSQLLTKFLQAVKSLRGSA